MIRYALLSTLTIGWLLSQIDALPDIAKTGVSGGLIVVLILFYRDNRADRKEHREEITGIHARNLAATIDLQSRHKADLADLALKMRDDCAALRGSREK